MPEIIAEVEETVDVTATVAATPGSLTDDYNDLQNHPSINGVVLIGDKSTNDLHIDHVPLADNLVATTGTTDTTPYVSRASQGPIAELRKIVGGTLAWNQLVMDADFSSTAKWGLPSSGAVTSTISNGVLKMTVADNTLNVRPNPYQTFAINPTLAAKANHVYLLCADIKITSSTTGNYPVGFLYGGVNASAIISNPTRNTWLSVQKILKQPSTDYTTYGFNLYFSNYVTYLNNGDTIEVRAPQVFDLTQMFGSTIADAILAMETATAGSGVAFFRSLFPSAYYPYSAPTLESVQASARQALDGNGNVMRSYPLDSDLTLRGIPKLTNGQLEYDGDIYLPTGEVTRRYGVVDLGTLTWGMTTLNNTTVFRTSGLRGLTVNTANGICSKYIVTQTFADIYTNGYMLINNGYWSSASPWTVVHDDAFSDATAFKNAMSGVYLVYELATPTTESAVPYTEVQLAGETEQFVTTNSIPVGNESFYPEDLTNVVQNLAPLPTTAGTYKLQVTVTGGVPSYSWVAG